MSAELRRAVYRLAEAGQSPAAIALGLARSTPARLLAGCGPPTRRPGRPS